MIRGNLQIVIDHETFSWFMKHCFLFLFVFFVRDLLQQKGKVVSCSRNDLLLDRQGHSLLAEESINSISTARCLVAELEASRMVGSVIIEEGGEISGTGR